MLSIPPDTEMLGAYADATGHGLRFAQAVSGFLVDWHTPNVVAATSVARKVKILAIGRPHGIPVDSRVLCHCNRIAPNRRNSPDIALPIADFGKSPICDSITVRRPLGLHGISGFYFALLLRAGINDP